MIFIDFLKAREEKNKYGMIPQNFNRSTNVAMEHNMIIDEPFVKIKQLQIQNYD